MQTRVYKEELKPYFKGGAYTHVQYCKKYFKEDRRMTMDKMLELKFGETEESKSFI